MAKSNARTVETETETEIETSTGSASASKRQAKASVSYSADGNPDNATNSPLPESKFIHIEFADGTERATEVASFPAGVIACATAQGLVTRFQRGYQNIKEVDKVIESFDETLADLLNDIWVEVGSGEPKVTQLANAVVLALEEKGETVDDARRASIIEKLKGKEFNDKAKSNPQVMAHLAQIQLEAAQKRADERRKAAMNSTGNETALSDF